MTSAGSESEHVRLKLCRGTECSLSFFSFFGVFLFAGDGVISVPGPGSGT